MFFYKNIQRFEGYYLRQIVSFEGQRNWLKTAIDLISTFRFTIVFFLVPSTPLIMNSTVITFFAFFVLFFSQIVH